MAIGSTTSAADSPPAWVRWVIPSAGDLVFAALLGLLAFTALSVRLLGDAGIGWHIRTGQMIVATHAIPRVDPFSATFSVTNSQPWFAWEWLYDLLVGWLETAAGLNGVVLFTALVIAMVFTWTFRLLLRRGTNVLVAVVLVLLAASAEAAAIVSNRAAERPWNSPRNRNQRCNSSFPTTPESKTTPP